MGDAEGGERTHTVAVRKVENAIEAELARGALQVEGIPCVVQTFHDSAYGGVFVLQKGWGVIHVPAHHKDRATRILDETLSGKKGGHSTSSEPGAV